MERARRRLVNRELTPIELYWGRIAHRNLTAVERYWGRHTVNSLRFRTAAESEEYLEWRFAEYPLFRELMELSGNHAGETLLDYGCGPGDDVTGFLLYTGCDRVVGVDISEKALGLTSSRLALHGVDSERYELLHVSDAEPGVPLADGSVDYVHSGGVIHHTSEPERVLVELARTLRPGGRGRLMVYNRNSLWFHLHTAYERRVLNNLFAGLSPDEAFARNTDGPECPTSRAFRPEEFCELADAAGLEIEFLGGYFAKLELDAWQRTRNAAIGDPRLADEHREFLEALEVDADRYPRFEGRHAGVGGVYAVRKPGETPAEEAHHRF